MTGDSEPVDPGDESKGARRTEGRSRRRGKQWLLALIVAVAGSVLVVVVRPLHDSPPSADLRRAALAVETRVRKSGKPKKADDIAAACRNTTCACVRMAARNGFDVDAASEILPLLEESAKTCSGEASLFGLRAEALARANGGELVKVEADQVLAKEPENPYALYAMALFYHRASRQTDATRYLDRAIASGRGAQAKLLAGIIAYQAGDYESAAREFQATIELEPDNLDALYNLALISQRQNRYRDAREGYLKVANLDPARQDARFNLAVLAHSIGARDEAMHHLAKLESIAPRDERTERLKAVLTAAPAPGTSAAPNFLGSIGVAPAGAKGVDLSRRVSP